MHFMVFLAYIVVLRYTVLHSNYEYGIALRLCKKLHLRCLQTGIEKVFKQCVSVGVDYSGGNGGTGS